SSDDDEVVVLKVVKKESRRIIKKEESPEQAIQEPPSVETDDGFRNLLYNIYEGMSRRPDAQMQMSILRLSALNVLNKMMDEE
uniref:BESS domain-containing protein n=1 Tax=Steinernema glaseri TaxID=37863 RepID=A0A1I7YKM2_9BILA